MEDPNITIKESIKLEEEKARRPGKVYNLETAMYGKSALSCEPMVSSLNNKKIDFRISFNESDDEYYTHPVRPKAVLKGWCLNKEVAKAKVHPLLILLSGIRCQGYATRSSPVALLRGVRHLKRRFASGRKQRAIISGGQFIARLAEHFGLLTEERLHGLTLIVRDLPVIDMAELARLQIWALGKQHEVMDAMARDFSRFTVWAAGGISQLLDSAGATYVWYSETHVPSQRRRVKQRTREASTLAALLDEDQPDP
nr:hypothetical protein [Tanacetum cinerariifolium]